MKKTNLSFLLLARSFNDVDCRLPFLEHAQAMGHKCKVFIYPLNQGVANSAFIQNQALPSRIPIIDVWSTTSLFRQFLIVLRKWLVENKRLAYYFMQQIFKVDIQLGANELIFKALYSQILETGDRSIILVDELIFQKDRSRVFDRLLSSLKIRVVSFLTGQSTFLTHPPLRGSVIKENFHPAWEIPFFVPDRLNAEHSLATMPLQNVRICGNTRFDFRRFRKPPSSAKQPKVCHRTLLFLLSKPEYGVDLERLYKLISGLDEISNQEIILRYHTRGFPGKMRLGSPRIRHEFFVASSELIARADAVFFTSSSMVFEAFILKKPVCYLKNCQKFPTIFDQMPRQSQAFTLKEAVDFARAPHVLPEIWTEPFLARHVYNGNQAGDVCGPLLKLITEPAGQLFTKPAAEQ